MKPQLIVFEDEMLMFLTTNDTALPWLLSWHLGIRRLQVQLIDGGSLEPPPQVPAKQTIWLASHSPHLLLRLGGHETNPRSCGNSTLL
jgi:hypothetical protein